MEEGGSAIARLDRTMKTLMLGFAAAIALQGTPSSSVQAAPGVLILQKKANSLGLYDSNTGQRRWTAPVGVKPHEMVLSQGNRFAYITDYGVDSYTSAEEGGKTISIVDLAQGRRIGTIDLGTFRRPHGIVLGLSGRAYVTVDRPAAVIEVDVEARRVAAQHLLDQKLPHMVAVSPDERFLYVANAGSGTISIVERRAGGETRHVEVGGVPMGLALDRPGRRLFVATRDANVVAVVDCAAARVVGRISLAGSPARVRLSPDDRVLAVTLIGSGDLVVLNTDSMHEVARLRVGAGAEGVTLDARSGFGYASAQGANTVVKFSLTDWRRVLDIATDQSPDPIEIIEVGQVR
jgi:YVTN family beta-propeller protein